MAKPKTTHAERFALRAISTLRNLGGGSNYKYISTLRNLGGGSNYKYISTLRNLGGGSNYKYLSTLRNLGGGSNYKHISALRKLGEGSVILIIPSEDIPFLINKYMLSRNTAQRLWY